MGEGEQKRKPPAPPPAKGKREASEDAKTSVYKPIPLEQEAGGEDSPLPPRKRGSTLSGIPGRKDEKKLPSTEGKGSDSGTSSIPPPAPLLGGAANKTWGLAASPKPVAPAKTAGPFKVRPPEPPPEPATAKAPEPVKLEKTAGPWKVPAVPPAVPLPPKGSAREPGPASPPPPPVPEEAEPAPPSEGEREGTTTTGLVAALTDEMVAAQEAEEAAAAEAEDAQDAASGEDSAASGVHTLVGGRGARQLDAASIRFLAAGWFVAGAALIGLFWALSGDEPQPQPVADVRPSVVAAPMPILVLSQAAPKAESETDDLEPVVDDEAAETGGEEAEAGEELGEEEGGLEEDAEPADDPEPAKKSRSARPRSKSRSKKPTPEPAPAPTPAPKPAATPKPKPPAPKSAAQLLSEARAAYKRGDAAKAHELAKASRAKSKTTAATELMVRSSCKRKQASTAARELKLLPLLKRGAVKRDCRAMGVKL